MTKVFGIGWAKTGTTTLGACLRILGYDHQSQDLELVRDIPSGDLTRVLAQVARKESFEDWPWLILYRELDRAFPGSRFVLTIRDTERWFRSYANMLSNQGVATEEQNEIRRILYQLPFPNVSKDQLVERYSAHNDEVKRYFRDRAKDLLVVNWEDGAGWQELCDFLGRDIPDAAFPHANRGDYTIRPTIRRAASAMKQRIFGGRGPR